MKQYPLPTEVIPKNTWINIMWWKKQVRALTMHDSEIVDGVHLVEVMGFGFGRKVIPVTDVVARLYTIGAGNE